MQQLLQMGKEEVVGKVLDVDCIVKRELDAEEAAMIRAAGFEVLVRRNHTIIEAKAGYLPPIYDFLRREIVAEEGGAQTSSGCASVYADLIGNRLRNFRPVTTGSRRSGYGHVKLPLEFKAVFVSAAGPRNAWKDVTVSVETVDTVSFEILRKVLWQGYRLYADKLDAVLPPRMEKYREAINAAMIKADDVYHRRTFFYTREKERP
jgi:hypothetical protein